jgi:hypothetical protein
MHRAPPLPAGRWSSWDEPADVAGRGNVPIPPGRYVVDSVVVEWLDPHVGFRPPIGHFDPPGLLGGAEAAPGGVARPSRLVVTLAVGQPLGRAPAWVAADNGEAEPVLDVYAPSAAPGPLTRSIRQPRRSHVVGSLGRAASTVGAVLRGCRRRRIAVPALLAAALACGGVLGSVAHARLAARAGPAPNAEPTPTTITSSGTVQAWSGSPDCGLRPSGCTVEEYRHGIAWVAAVSRGPVADLAAGCGPWTSGTELSSGAEIGDLGTARPGAGGGLELLWFQDCGTQRRWAWIPR